MGVFAESFDPIAQHRAARKAEQSRKRDEQLARDDAAEAARNAEERRLAARSWWEKIEEVNDLSEVKALLHELVESLNLE